MTPGGRAQAAIDVLEAILSPPAGREDVPGDMVLAGYTRKRRYIGSKDRRAITEMVWQALRYRGVAAWRLGTEDLTARLLLAMVLEARLGWSTAERDAAFDGKAYGPQPFSPEEASALQTVTAGDPPLAAHANLPPWLAGEAAAVLPEDDAAAWQALATEAPKSLRANTLKADPAACFAALREAGLAVEPSAIAPLGFTMQGRANLSALPVYRDGWIEIQDIGSQIAAGLVDAQPGMSVLDYCAGGGGKSLALAAAMDNTGRLVATDTDQQRLAPLEARAARAGATVIEARTIDPGAPVEPGAFDRVLVDAPCSGSGAWRRRPEAPWRLTPQRYADLQQKQRDILRAAAASVREGGRVIYVTCSIFRAENDDVVTDFLRQHAHYRSLPAAEIWRAVLGTAPPISAINGDFVRLLPHKLATDGFFIAILERVGGC